MSKLDDELYNPWKRESIIPPYWEICKICKVPFKTSIFINICSRCSVFDLERINLFHAILLRVLIFLIIYIVISIFLILYILKYTHQFYFLILPPFLLLVLLGKILYGILIKLDYA